MKDQALFGVSLSFSLAAWGIVVWLYLWPDVGTTATRTAMIALLAPHMFRFIGLGFLIPGVVSQKLPAAFAGPAAWGDLIAAFLAMIAIVVSVANVPWAIAFVWVFNIFGTADLLYALFQGPRQLQPLGSGALGVTYYLPTLIVPGLLASHVLIFRLLV